MIKFFHKNGAYTTTLTASLGLWYFVREFCRSFNGRINIGPYEKVFLPAVMQILQGYIGVIDILQYKEIVIDNEGNIYRTKILNKVSNFKNFLTDSYVVEYEAFCFSILEKVKDAGLIYDLEVT